MPINQIIWLTLLIKLVKKKLSQTTHSLLMRDVAIDITSLAKYTTIFIFPAIH